MFKYFKKRFQALTFFEIFVSISIIVFTVFVIKFFGQKIEWKTVRIEIINKSEHNERQEYQQHNYHKQGKHFAVEFKVHKVCKNKNGFDGSNTESYGHSEHFKIKFSN